MKQLLIVNSKTALNGGASTPRDLSNMAAGAIGFYQLDDTSKWLSAKPTKNFAIVLGGGGKKVPFIIPEVDVNSLSVTYADYDHGNNVTAGILMPEPVSGKTYTLMFVKGGTTFNERSTWTVSEYIPEGVTKTANELAKAFATRIQSMIDLNGFPFRIVGNGITGAGNRLDFYAQDTTQWKIIPTDGLAGVSLEDVQNASPAVGDKAYIQDLASRCAAGKGFNYLGEDSGEIYPGYPEVVEDTQYDIITLRFAVPRVASKTRDEVVNQVVHIAVPSASSIINTVKVILGLSDAAAASAEE
jgi:hypothetical protein